MPSDNLVVTIPIICPDLAPSTGLPLLPGFIGALIWILLIPSESLSTAETLSNIDLKAFITELI
jgi:hypothetical protein